MSMIRRSASIPQGNEIPDPVATREPLRRRRRFRTYRQNQVRVVLLVPLAIIFLLLLLLVVLFRSQTPTDQVPQSQIDPGVLFPPKFPKISRRYTNLVSQQALQMCTKALWHTVETTTVVLPNEETFIFTGDIDDLWLRDASAQVHPLLIPVLNGTSLVQQDAKLDRIVAGLIQRMATYIRHDPYANAFRIDTSYVFSEAQKKLGRHDLISTWNYELDSACYYIRLLYFYWKQRTPRQHVISLPQVVDAIEIMIDLWTAEQQHELDHYPYGPLFDCLNCNKPYRYPGLPRQGKGTPTNASTGLIWNGFRPSDDACEYGYHIPANMMAVVALGYVEELATQLWHRSDLADKARRLASDVEQGLKAHAIVRHTEFGDIYAYEVDGFGNYLLMDDANVPSLLSIPYLGYNYDPVVYKNTRRFIFSPHNPTYHSHDALEGYGSPHTDVAIPQNIWPMALAVQGLVSEHVREKVEIIETLVQLSAGTLWMHESVDVRNPRRYTRSWFCWADALFAELVLSVTDACLDDKYRYRVHEWRDPHKVQGGQYARGE